MENLYREGADGGANSERLYPDSSKEYPGHSSAALLADEDAHTPTQQLQSEAPPDLHDQAVDRNDNDLQLIENDTGIVSIDEKSDERLHNEYMFSPDNYPHSQFAQLTQQELQLHQQAVQEHMLQFQQFQNIQQTQQILYDQALQQNNASHPNSAQLQGSYQHNLPEQPQSNNHQLQHQHQNHQQQHQLQHQLQQQHLHQHQQHMQQQQQQQQQHPSAHLHHHAQHNQHQHHQQMQQLGINRQVQGASSMSTEDQAAVVAERKKSKTLYPWLEVSGPACLSERQEARLSEQANVSKKYKNMRCLYCMKFNPVTPWASMRPRKYEMSSLQDHANSAHHLKSERLREESMQFPAMVPTVVYQIQDDVVPGRSPTDMGGVPKVNQMSKPQYSRNKRSLAEMTKTHATRGALRPAWLHTEGGLIFSDRQLNDPARPAGLMRKYQMMMCTLCAQHSPRSPWATMKSRKFEARLLAEHELSTHHQKSLSSATSPSAPSQHSLQAVPGASGHAPISANHSTVSKSIGAVEHRYPVQGQPIMQQQQPQPLQQQQQQHLQQQSQPQLQQQQHHHHQQPQQIGGHPQLLPPSQSSAHNQMHAHSMFLQAQAQQAQMLAQQRQQQLQQIHAHQMQHMHSAPFNPSVYQQQTLDGHFTDPRTHYFASQHDSAAIGGGYPPPHSQHFHQQQLHHVQHQQSHLHHQQQPQQYLAHVVENPNMLYSFGSTEGHAIVDYDEAQDQSLFYPDPVEHSLYEPQVLGISQGHGQGQATLKQIQPPVLEQNQSTQEQQQSQSLAQTRETNIQESEVNATLERSKVPNNFDEKEDRIGQQEFMNQQGQQPASIDVNEKTTVEAQTVPRDH